MFINTNQVIDDIANVVSGNVDKTITNGLPIDFFNRQGQSGTVSVNYNIKRLFVLHNFREGYIWIRYTWQGYDNFGKRTYSSVNIPCCLKIQKANGKWVIIQVSVAP